MSALSRLRAEQDRLDREILATAQRLCSLFDAMSPCEQQSVAHLAEIHRRAVVECGARLWWRQQMWDMGRAP